MMNTILALWFKPRKGVQYLQGSPRFQLGAMLGLCVLYLLQVSAFLLSLENYSITPLLTYKGLLLVVFFFLFLCVAAFVVVQGASLAFWLSAQCFRGQGSLLQTRAAVVWTLMGSIPMGFFWVMLYWGYRLQAVLGKVAGILGAFSYVGALATVIYMFANLVIGISETHKMGLWRAFFTVLLGLVILVAMGYCLLPVYQSLSRSP